MHFILAHLNKNSVGRHLHLTRVEHEVGQRLMNSRPSSEKWPKVLLVQTDSKQLKEVQPTQRIKRMLQTFHWKLLGFFLFSYIKSLFAAISKEGQYWLEFLPLGGRKGVDIHWTRGGARKTYLKTLINFFRFLTQDVPLDSLDSEPLIFFSQSIFQPSEEEKTSLSCGKISKNVNQVHLFS